MIALGSDHGGFSYKEKIKTLLDSIGMEHRDFGSFDPGPSDYPEFAAAVARAVSGGDCEKGILVCGSGIGVDIVANKFEGIRSALCLSVEMAVLSRQHNDANILSLGERITSWETVEQMVRAWLSTSFEGGRHKRRVDKIHDVTGL